MATPRRRGALLLDLNACSLLSAALLRERLREAGIKPEQFDLLTEIQLGRPITPTELALRTGYRPATLYDHVEQLLARGHIERSPNPRDHRSYHLSTTPAGGEALRLGSKAVGQVVRGVLPHVDQSLEELEQRMWELRRALEQAHVSSLVD